MNRLLSAATIALSLSTLTVIAAGDAQAATHKRCTTGGDGRTGVCYSTPSVARHTVVVEAVPLVNKSSKTVSQTAAQASTAGGSVRLAPHQSVTCERTYGWVTSTVTRTEWSDSRTWKQIYHVKVPSYLGATFVD